MSRSIRFATILACVATLAAALVAAGGSSGSAAVLSPSISSVGGSYTAVPVHALPVVSVPVGHSARVPLSGVPSSNVGSVVLTVSVVDPAAGGWISVGTKPASLSRGLVFAAGQSASNQMVVPLGTDHGLEVTSTAHSVIPVRLTVTGYLVAGAPGTPGAFGSASEPPLTVRVPARSSSTVPGAALSGIPAGARDAVFQVAVAKPTAAGSVSVAAAGASAPDVANAVFAVGKPTVSLTEVALADGSVTVFNTAPRSQLVNLYLVGYHRAGTPAANGVVRTLTPRPWIDTTMGVGLHANRVPDGKRVWTLAGGRSGVPAEGVRAVIVTLEVHDPTTAGNLAAYATGDPGAGSAARPDPAVDNPVARFEAGRGVAAATTAVLNVGDGGKITLVNNSAGTLHLVADVVGYVTAPGGFSWAAPRAVSASSGDVNALSCRSATFCLAVTSGGYALSWDGATWSPALLGRDVNLTGVSCATPTFCVAVDDTGNTYTREGGAWSAPTRITTAELTSVSCATTNFCAAVGASGTRLTLHGGAWTSAPDPGAADLLSVSCPATNSCQAVDASGGAVAYSSAGWGARQVLDDAAISSVSCATPTFCVARVLYGGEYVVFKGSAWSAIRGTRETLGVTVSCPTTTFCVSGGATGHSVFNGYTWSGGTGSGGSNVASGVVSCASATSCIGVAYDQASVYDGTAWTAPLTFGLIGYPFRGVDCLSVSFCMGRGVGAITTTYNGTGWDAAVQAIGLSGPDDHALGFDLGAIGCSSPIACIASYEATYPGLDEPVDLEWDFTHYDSGTWTRTYTSVGNYGQFNDVSCLPGALRCVVSGGNGLVWLYTATGGTVVGDGTTQAVSCTSASFCALVAGGTVAFFNGHRLSSFTSIDAGHSIEDVSCAARTCVAVDDAGRAVRYDGSSWSAPKAIDDHRLTSVSCPSASMCVAVDDSGNAVRFDGTTWTAPVKIDVAAVVDVSCPRTTFCVAVDSDGYSITGY